MTGLAPWNMFGDEWLTTRRAAKLLFLATLLLPTATVQSFGWANPSDMRMWEKVVWCILAVADVLAILFLWLGMCRYWVRLDDSRAFAKRIWFPVVFFGLWWGAGLYHYCVYLPQVLCKWRSEG
jgi:hypothetical protein